MRVYGKPFLPWRRNRSSLYVVHTEERYGLRTPGLHGLVSSPQLSPRSSCCGVSLTDRVPNSKGDATTSLDVLDEKTHWYSFPAGLVGVTDKAASKVDAPLTTLGEELHVRICSAPLVCGGWYTRIRATPSLT